MPSPWVLAARSTSCDITTGHRNSAPQRGEEIPRAPVQYRKFCPSDWRGAMPTRNLRGWGLRVPQGLVAMSHVDPIAECNRVVSLPQVVDILDANLDRADHLDTVFVILRGFEMPTPNSGRSCVDDETGETIQMVSQAPEEAITTLLMAAGYVNHAPPEVFEQERTRLCEWLLRPRGPRERWRAVVVLAGLGYSVLTSMRTTTIYFDTQFYVHLARATEAVAARIVDGLCNLAVRPVLSCTLLRELLTSADREDGDRRLHAAVSRFRAGTFQTAPNLSWDVLLTAGTARQAVSGILRTMDDTLSQAESYSLVAGRPTTDARAREANLAVCARMELLNAKGEVDLETMLRFFGPLLHTYGIDLPCALTPEMANRVRDELLARLDPDELAHIIAQNAMRDSVVATDNRPYEVVLETALPHQRKRLANTYRDSEHMQTFMEHAGVIDFLQIDQPQLNQVRQTGSRHRLAMQGFANRCFAATDLDDTVTQVERLVRGA